MNEKLKKIYAEFIREFGYAPKLPAEVNFDQYLYGIELRQCIKDKKDYTVEKYGTKPPKTTGFSSILID